MDKIFLESQLSFGNGTIKLYNNLVQFCIQHYWRVMTWDNVNTVKSFLFL